MKMVTVLLMLFFMMVRQEATSQNSLVIDAVKLATQFLAPKELLLPRFFNLILLN